jgi:hypothetical protein
MLPILKSWPKGEPLPAISLREPWAACVTFFGKDVENRSNWKFRHRGPMLIHASKSKMFVEDLEAAAGLLRADGFNDEEILNHFTAEQALSSDFFGYGDIVAVANLANVFGVDDDIPEDHPAADSPWSEDDAGYWLYFAQVTPVIRHVSERLNAATTERLKSGHCE